MAIFGKVQTSNGRQKYSARPTTLSGDEILTNEFLRLNCGTLEVRIVVSRVDLYRGFYLITFSTRVERIILQKCALPSNSLPYILAYLVIPRMPEYMFISIINIKERY
jgi:hypothetical protein